MYEATWALKSPLVRYFISSEDLKKSFASPDCISPRMVWVQSLKKYKNLCKVLTNLIIVMVLA